MYLKQKLFGKLWHIYYMLTLPRDKIKHTLWWVWVIYTTWWWCPEAKFKQKSNKIRNFNFELIEVKHYIWLSTKSWRAIHPLKPKFFGEFGSIRIYYMVMVPRDWVQTPKKPVEIQNFISRFELIEIQHYIWLSTSFRKASHPLKSKFFGEFGSHILHGDIAQRLSSNTPKIS